MTGYTVHSGTSKKFSTAWDRIFGDKAPAKSSAKSAAKQKKSASKPAAKAGKKK